MAGTRKVQPDTVCIFLCINKYFLFFTVQQYRCMWRRNAGGTRYRYFSASFTNFFKITFLWKNSRHLLLCSIIVFLLVTLKMYLLIRLIKKHSTRSNKMNKQESVYYYYFHWNFPINIGFYHIVFLITNLPIAIDKNICGRNKHFCKIHLNLLHQ